MEKVREPHPNIGCWWTLYDYGLEAVKAWPADYKHPFPGAVLTLSTPSARQCPTGWTDVFERLAPVTGQWPGVSSRQTHCITCRMPALADAWRVCRGAEASEGRRHPQEAAGREEGAPGCPGGRGRARGAHRVRHAHHQGPPPSSLRICGACSASSTCEGHACGVPVSWAGLPGSGHAQGRSPLPRAWQSISSLTTLYSCPCGDLNAEVHTAEIVK